MQMNDIDTINNKTYSLKPAFNEHEQCGAASVGMTFKKRLYCVLHFYFTVVFNSAMQFCSLIT